MDEEVRCAKESEIARLEVKVDDLERRCRDKEKDVEHIRLVEIPNLVERRIESLSNRMRVLEGWQKWAVAWAAGFGAGVALMAKKFF